jgi:hypothetical protein
MYNQDSLILKKVEIESRGCPLNPGDPENKVVAVVKLAPKEPLSLLYIKGFDST